MIAAALLLAAQAEAAFEGQPDVTVAYYDVAGTDPAAIRAAMDQARPRDPNDGIAVDALTRFAINWRWRGDPADPCGLSRMTLSMRAFVTLPRLVGPTPAATTARWEQYRVALAAHEGRHVARVFARRGELMAALQGATCATANAAGDAVLARIKDDEIAYDVATDHGRTEGARFP